MVRTGDITRVPPALRESLEATTSLMRKAVMRRFAALALGTVIFLGALTVPASADTGIALGPIQLALPGGGQFAQLQGMNINVGTLLG
ncbi:hypothetical protein [Streptomyces lateritius]|uniref:hypothetical protein n=1 Tax=Streptomyces lateritius TaxID=67313 RepID=UPI001675EDD1|nr:hypothetical protein [Streptomyces lateritius]GGU14399.1 hypothetical protein GCM10010272_69300 [Streptomyces lateritius]